ncbi:V-type proton ATPase subunit F [Drosophila elegans]|uniref:V-type proton ATPase subunit F n=1 Tax=Drosophila elegans TaxID=30023 RepID=UPI0007E71E32|nr:V-type proton ATPase subunit F [Drosophila elegans]
MEIRRADIDAGSDSDSNGSYFELQRNTVLDDPNILRIAIMADPEVTLGFLLAGVGYQKDRFRNYMMVESETLQEDVEQFFLTVYRKPHIGIIILDYDTNLRLRTVLQRCNQMLPVLITVPNKSSLTTYLDKKDRNRRLRQRDAY